MDNAFEWIQRNGGLCTEEDYPYTATQETCKAKNCQLVPGSKVKAWTDVRPKEEALVKVGVTATEGGRGYGQHVLIKVPWLPSHPLGCIKMIQ